MKPLRMFACCVVFLLTLSGTAVLGDDTPEELTFPTGTWTLTAPPDSVPEPKLSPVEFPHSLHFAYACTDCHHTWDGNSAVQSCAATDCHENLWAAAPGTTPKGKKRVKSLAGAYHQVCRDCHRDELKAQKAAKQKKIYTGPIACEGCHPETHSEVEESSETLTIPLGSLTLEAPEGAEMTRGSVDFPHGTHFQFSCQSCHHEWDGESEVVGCSTEDCHDQLEADPSTRDIRAEENVLYYLAAYHNACIPCHRDMQNQRKDMEATGLTEEEMIATGPVACDECHSE